MLISKLKWKTLRYLNLSPNLHWIVHLLGDKKAFHPSVFCDSRDRKKLSNKVGCAPLWKKTLQTKNNWKWQIVLPSYVFSTFKFYLTKSSSFCLKCIAITVIMNLFEELMFFLRDDVATLTFSMLPTHVTGKHNTKQKMTMTFSSKCYCIASKNGEKNKQRKNLHFFHAVDFHASRLSCSRRSQISKVSFITMKTTN